MAPRAGAAVRVYRSVQLTLDVEAAAGSAPAVGEGPRALYEQEQGRPRVRLYGPVSSGVFTYLDANQRLTSTPAAVRGITLTLHPAIAGADPQQIQPVVLRFGVVPGGAAFRLGVTAQRPTLADARCLVEGDTVFNRGQIGPCEFGSTGIVWVDSPDTAYVGEELLSLIGHSGAWGPGSTLRQPLAEWTVSGAVATTGTGPSLRLTPAGGTPAGQSITIRLRVPNERGILLTHERTVVTAVRTPPPPAALPRVALVGESGSGTDQYRFTDTFLDPVPGWLTVTGEQWQSGPNGLYGAWQNGTRL